MANSKVFGGDGAKERAEKYAGRTGGLVIPLDELPRAAKEHFGLDLWDRKGGVTYTHAVIVEQATEIQTLVVSDEALAVGLDAYLSPRGLTDSLPPLIENLLAPGLG